MSLGGAFAGQKTWRAAERAASGKKKGKGAGAYQQAGRTSLDIANTDSITGVNRCCS